MGYSYTDDDIYFDYLEGLFMRCKREHGDDPQRSANLVLLESIQDRYFNAGFMEGRSVGFKQGLEIARKTIEAQGKPEELSGELSEWD